MGKSKVKYLLDEKKKKMEKRRKRQVHSEGRGGKKGFLSREEEGKDLFLR